MPTLKSAPELFEVIYGTPKCRHANQIARSFESRPHLPLAPLQATLPWRWYPWKIRLYVPKVLRAIAAIIALTSVILFGTLFRSVNIAAWLLIVLLNVFFTMPLLYLAYIMEWNFQLREGLCWAMGKAAQARAQWQHSNSLEQAKFVFFEWRVTKNFRLVVLNDGTQEVWNMSGAELGEDIATALGVAGFVGNSTSFSDVGLSVSNNDAAYSSKIVDQLSPGRNSPQNPYIAFRELEIADNDTGSASV